MGNAGLGVVLSSMVAFWEGLNMSRKTIPSMLAVASVVIALAAASAGAQTITFRKVADLSTPIPSGTGNFTALSGYDLYQGDVVFLGAGTSDQQGIYTSIAGVPEVVADLSTPIPGGTGNFTTFLSSAPSIDSGHVAFFGVGSGGQYGIYATIGGTLHVVADQNTPIPGGNGNFGGGQTPSIEGERVLFPGAGDGQKGLFLYEDGSLSIVADLNTPIPGGTGYFTTIMHPSLASGNVAFANGQTGIYTRIGETWGVVADKNTPIPGGTGNFTQLVHPSFDGQHVAFGGYGEFQIGVYTDKDGTLDVVADDQTAIPSGEGNFNIVVDASIDGGHVAFLGANVVTVPTQRGIYTDIGGSLFKVIDLTDSLDGKDLSLLGAGRGSLSGNEIFFWAKFTDDSHGLFIATISDICGNGVVDAGEQCDDNNIEDGDGCSSTCLVEDGWNCTGEPSVCWPAGIPTVSEWGLVTMALLLLSSGTVVFVKRRVTA